MPVAFNVGVVEAQFRYTSLGERVENTLWLRTTEGTAPDLERLEQLGEDLFEWWDVNLQPNQANSTILREIYLRQAIQDGALEFTFVPTGTAQGGAAEGQIANNVTLVVSFRTGLSGRSFRGRNYIIGMVKSQVTGNQVNSAYAADLLTAYSHIPDTLSANNEFFHVVYSQFHNGVPRAGGGIATAVTSYLLVDTNVDSQRRRLAGRGT